jgi:lysophospholipase L1-like esterase
MVPEAVKANPAVVVVAGGRNDGKVDAARIRAAFADLRTDLPDATIYAVSPVWDSKEPPAFLAAQGREVKASVEAVGGTYLDVGQPLKGHPELITPDGVHPNVDGYRMLADAVNARLD